MIQALITNEQTQALVVGFVNDIDFNSDSENAQQKMQSILDIYARLYEATGRYIEYSKMTFYSQQWKTRK